MAEHPGGGPGGGEDEAEEAVAAGVRAGVTAAGLVVERAARNHEQQSRDAQAAQLQAARELRARADAEHVTAAAVDHARTVADPGLDPQTRESRESREAGEAVTLVVSANAGDAVDRAAALEPEAAESARLAGLHQARPASEAVLTPPAGAEKARKARGQGARTREQQRSLGR